MTGNILYADPSEYSYEYFGEHEYAPSPRHSCPTCKSRYPERHPAVQCEGEVELCVDDFHLIPTSANRPDYIAAVHAKRTLLAARQVQS